MTSLELLQNLNELQIAKLTWVWWYLKHVDDIGRDDFNTIFQVLKEECGEQVTVTFFRKFVQSTT